MNIRGGKLFSAVKPGIDRADQDTNHSGFRRCFSCLLADSIELLDDIIGQRIGVSQFRGFFQVREFVLSHSNISGSIMLWLSPFMNAETISANNSLGDSAE